MKTCSLGSHKPQPLNRSSQRRRSYQHRRTMIREAPSFLPKPRIAENPLFTDSNVTYCCVPQSDDFNFRPLTTYRQVAVQHEHSSPKSVSEGSDAKYF